MRHFQKIAEGLPVTEVMDQLYAHPDLWDQHGPRKEFEGSPHVKTSDIWVRFNAYKNLDPENYAAFSNEHIPEWYPAWDRLPALKPVVYGLMSRVQGEMLGGVLITKVKPGGVVEPHQDKSWHVDFYRKFYVSLQSEDGSVFGCKVEDEIEELRPKTGECWLFDNHKTHWVQNTGSDDRVTLIVCIRTDKFGGYQ